MPRDEILAMTPDQLREEIAQRKGYEKRGAVKLSNGDFMPIYSAPTGKTTHTLPDWTHDIDAMFALEDELPAEERSEYLVALANSVCVSKDVFYYAGYFGFSSVTHEAAFALVHASPLDRARAWVMWDEGRKSRL